MTTLKERVLAECKKWENTDETLDGPTPPKVHPSEWEIWDVGYNRYEFHRHTSNGLYVELSIDQATYDDYEILAQLLGIGGAE